ncbi:hypothetical protein E2C01_063654 [Portunus trituberculatus]|uniref:Uncharacterized protein n=1 Tax=Portunus trituberculatus TaxID=210409 RepID=A0A5B7HB14_PORTR|nr:hypothetical protein [Portunus trituberculatus]
MTPLRMRRQARMEKRDPRRLPGRLSVPPPCTLQPVTTPPLRLRSRVEVGGVGKSSKEPLSIPAPTLMESKDCSGSIGPCLMSKYSLERRRSW